MAKGISVIIACFNSEKVIEKTLIHLQNQKKSQHIAWEVILVDNRSTDNTSEIAKSTWAKKPIVPMQLLWEEKIGLANARKTSVLAAKYDILCIVDDDNWVEEEWIAKISSYFENPEIGIVGCAGEGAFEEIPPVWFHDNQHAFAIGQLYEGSFIDVTNAGLVPGAGMSIRKVIYDTLYGLRWTPFLQGRVGAKQSAGDDSEMCMVTRLLGYKIFYSNDLKFKHFTTKQRITWERLKNMTEGFGEADVFVLPYMILHKEQQFGKSWATTLRKKWWINYLAKKTMYFSHVFFSNFTKTAFNKKHLAAIRTNAFCKRIWKEKSNFNQYFEMLEGLSIAGKKSLSSKKSLIEKSST
jgi:glycosyltransferase involved in cell wall biosynthesis